MFFFVEMYTFENVTLNLVGRQQCGNISGQHHLIVQLFQGVRAVFVVGRLVYGQPKHKTNTHLVREYGGILLLTNRITLSKCSCRWYATKSPWKLSSAVYPDSQTRPMHYFLR